MKNFLIIYVISQLITTAYGLAVIESARPFIEKELRDKGYHKNKNSLYKFNNTLFDVLKGFIPFYYFVKALRITLKKGDVQKEVQEQIDSKKYVNDVDEIVAPDIQIIEENKTEGLVNNMNLAFEKPEKYKAIKNNISLYDTYETPIEYNSTMDDSLELTPFINNERVVEQVVVKNEVTSKDIAKAICDLNVYELSLLKEKIDEKIEEKIQNESKGLKLEKDVA